MSDLVSAEFTRQFGGEHGLPMEPLENVLVSITNGRSPICESRPRVDAEWGVLKLGAVSSGSYRAAENKAYLGDRRPSDIEVRTGDVLMVRKNTPELVGAVTLVHATPPRLLLPDLVFRLEANHSKLTGTYLTHALMSPVLRDRVRGLASGSARSMSNISMAKLRSLHVPVPPLADQLAFEAFVENVASRRQRFEQSLSRFDSLLASLQARAFAGDL